MAAGHTEIMVNWNKIQRRNPQTGSLRWYPTIAYMGVATADDVIAGIVDKCTLTKVDVKAVLIALEDVIIEQLKNGNSVRFGNLGSFRPSIKARFYDPEKKVWGAGGCASPNDMYDPETGDLVTAGVNDTNIAGLGICFTKSSEMVKRLDRKELKFRNVPGEKLYKVKG